jgi:hypothetical protein
MRVSVFEHRQSPIADRSEMTPSEPSYREIPLTKGQVAIVDADLFDFLSQWTWFARWSSFTRSSYAMRYVGNGRHGTLIMMHRVVLGLPQGDPRQGDHRQTGQTLLNVRSNLRVSTPSQNQANQRRRRDNTSGFKGVTYVKKIAKWYAQIQKDGVKMNLGFHSTPELAHAAYREASVRLFGEFARGD